MPEASPIAALFSRPRKTVSAAAGWCRYVLDTRSVLERRLNDVVAKVTVIDQQLALLGAPAARLQANAGYHFGTRLSASANGASAEASKDNPLGTYFDRHTTGPGIWKWRHYFDIYERHFAKFVDREVHVVEIGVYSGGSLAMWRDYFGAKCHLYGVDIEPACRVYEEEGVRIFIGDQGDREFWRDFVEQVPTIDIVIDDGSHLPGHQILTLETLLPRIRPGGVFLCEDVHQPTNEFHEYVNGLSRHLHSMSTESTSLEQPATEFQRTVHSIHLYPYVTVIERQGQPFDLLVSAKHGTEWQPFYEEPAIAP